MHRRSIITADKNGSGAIFRIQAGHPSTRPDRAWQMVDTSAATHVVVHEGLYLGGRGPWVSNWLRSRGATEVATFATDRVFVLP